MMANDELCEQALAAADRDRYLANLYVPAVHRGAMAALFAFGTEIARVRERAREPMPGEIRLQWWRETLAGERNEEARANPLSAALLAMIERYGLSRQPFETLIDAHGFDLYDEPMPTLAALEQYADDTQGALLMLAAQCLDAPVAEAGTVLREAAMAQAIGGILQNFAVHAARGQLYVPLEVLGHFGAQTDDIHAGKTTGEVRAALAEMRLRARRHLDRAATAQAAIPAAVLPLLLPAALIRPTLARMERPDYDPFAAAEPLPPWRRQWLIWRAARNPARIFR
jgi:phytoene synthase